MRTLKLFLSCAASLFLLLPLSEIAAATPHPSYYRTIKKDGVWWFQAPEGKTFFSLGVNVVHVGASASDYHAEKPEYGAFQHYPSTDAWAEATLKRLQAWNFNTIGGWSQQNVERGPLPFTVVLDLGGSHNALWNDLFSPTIARKFDETARKAILPVRNNPYLLGYFSDNELGWWSDALFRHFIKQPSTNHTRQVLVRVLRKHYHGRFADLQRDFNTGKARGFATVGLRGEVTLKPGGRGLQAVDEFIFLLAQRYYQLAHQSIRRYDQKHLILGDRYAGWYPQSVARAAGPYVDVISTNYGAEWKDGEICHFYLDTLHRLTGKPILVSEFYFAAMENRSGNKNSSGLFPTVQTQRERAQAFHTNVTALAGLPYVIGAHWFQYHDEPTYGRTDDGEDYNMGLVDIEDRPYEELTAAAAALDVPAIHSRARNNRPAADPVMLPQLDPSLAETQVWNHKQALLVNATGMVPSLPFADLYAAWDGEAIYLFLNVADYTEAEFYAEDPLPRSDLMEWKVSTGGSGNPVTVRFGATSEPVVEGGPAVARMERGSTRFMVVLKLPAGSLAPGRAIPLDATLSSHGHLHTMHWKQALQLGPALR